MIKLSEIYIFFRYLDRKVAALLIVFLLIIPVAYFYGIFDDEPSNIEEFDFWKDQIDLGIEQLGKAMQNRSLEVSTIYSYFERPIFCYYPESIDQSITGKPIYNEWYRSELHTLNAYGFVLWRNETNKDLWNYEIRNDSRPYPSGTSDVVDEYHLISMFITDLNGVSSLHETSEDIDKNIEEIICHSSYEDWINSGEFFTNIHKVWFTFTDHSKLQFIFIDRSINQKGGMSKILIVPGYSTSSENLQQVYLGEFTGNFTNFIYSANQLIEFLG